MDELDQGSYLDKYNALIAQARRDEPPCVAGLSYGQRKGKAPAGYHSHHIVPLASGGSNKSENIVTLTIKDHLMAHWFYAKHFGGSHWAPVKFLYSSIDGSRITEIEAEALARIAESAFSEHKKSMRGSGNPFYGKSHTKQADKTIYEFKNLDGSVFVGTRLDFRDAHGLSSGRISGIILGSNKTANGWYVESTNPGGLSPKENNANVWRSRQEKVTMYHKDGRVWTGFPIDAPAYFAPNNKNKHVKGWFLSEADRDAYDVERKDRAHLASSLRGDISGESNPMFGADRRKDWKVLCVHKNGSVFDGSSKELADKMNLNKTCYASMVKTFRGVRVVSGFVVKSYKGWTCQKIEAA